MGNEEVEKTSCSCGANDFMVDEAVVWDGALDEAGVMQCTNADVSNSEVLKIICKMCNKVYGENDFNDINFN